MKAFSAEHKAAACSLSAELKAAARSLSASNTSWLKLSTACSFSLSACGPVLIDAMTFDRPSCCNIGLYCSSSNLAWDSSIWHLESRRDAEFWSCCAEYAMEGALPYRPVCICIQSLNLRIDPCSSQNESHPAFHILLLFIIVRLHVLLEPVSCDMPCHAC